MTHALPEGRSNGLPKQWIRAILTGLLPRPGVHVGQLIRMVDDALWLAEDPIPIGKRGTQKLGRTSTPWASQAS
jgi:hypothetical protein